MNVKMKKVSLSFVYFVPDDPELIEGAKNCVLEDLDSAVKYGELNEQIQIQDAPEGVTIDSTPSFLLEGTKYHPDFEQN